VKTFPKPLSTKEEYEFLTACKQGDRNAREQLILHNLRLVAHIVKKYSQQDNKTEELISVGTIGLIKAIDSYKIGKGSRLSTYAACCIENELLMLFRSEKKFSKDVSLTEPIGADKEGNEICLVDVLEAEQEDVVNRLYFLDNIKKLEIYMKSVLSEREQEIINLRYGLKGNKEYTQREIAKKMNISRSYVSRIEKKAIKKLRTCFQKYGEDMDCSK